MTSLPCVRPDLQPEVDKAAVVQKQGVSVWSLATKKAEKNSNGKGGDDDTNDGDDGNDGDGGGNGDDGDGATSVFSFGF